MTISCDTSANTCLIPVPAPAFALVFLTAEETISTVTFSTTAYTNPAGTATIAASVLATSNGMSGAVWELGSTSSGSTSAARALDADITRCVLVGAALVVLSLAF